VEPKAWPTHPLTFRSSLTPKRLQIKLTVCRQPVHVFVCAGLKTQPASDDRLVMMHPSARPPFNGQALVILLLLLVPSAAYLWQHDDLPQFCDFHDDCVYYVSAKSLADGGGYRVESLPGEPPQTKYPPLYPLLLSIAWRLDPHFPHNVPIAAWISWLALPAALILLSAYARWMGLKGWRAWLLLALFAANPYTIWFSSQLLSELLFLALSLAAMLLIERAAQADSHAAIAGVAGAVAGVAYLARSAGIVMLAVGLVYLWWMHKERRKAYYFAAAMLPFIAAWMVWTRVHATPTSDPVLLYYLDYVRYELYNVKLSDLHLYIWKNVDGLLLGLGSLILPKITTSLLLKIMAQVIAVAMISGVVRLVRRGDARLYAMFAAASVAMLLVWHFPPDERFVLPLFPLGLAGLLVEIEHLIAMLRAGLHHRDASQRVVAGAMLSAAVLIFGGALAVQLFVIAVFQPARAHENRMSKIEHVAAYGWIRASLPAGTRFLAYSDPAFYLYTGLPVTRRPILPSMWYHDDHAGMVEQWGNLTAFARERGLQYYYFMDSDLQHAPVEDDERAAITKAHHADPKMTAVYHKGDVTIYKFHD